MYKLILLFLPLSVFLLTICEGKSMEEKVMQSNKNEIKLKKRKLVQSIKNNENKEKKVSNLEENKNLDNELVLSIQEEWYKEAKEIANTWDQSLEELEKDAYKFLQEYRKLYPSKRCPFITELALHPKPSNENINIQKFSVPMY